jgi:hypothetical protein
VFWEKFSSHHPIFNKINLDELIISGGVIVDYFLNKDPSDYDLFFIPKNSED